MNTIEELIEYIETFQDEKNWSNEIWLIKVAAIKLKESQMNKDLRYYKENCKEDYLYTPISVLRYITELEKRQPLPKFNTSGSNEWNEGVKSKLTENK
tara:strand:+ start:507 stop:800 length:294 start_codon:yes stop_codon:yes gene_type:complete